MRTRGRNPVLAVASLACAMVIIVAIVVSLSASNAESPDGLLLDCDELVEQAGEYGEGTITAETPELLMEKTEYLEFLGVPVEGRSLVTNDPSPNDGLVEVAPDADGQVTEAEIKGDTTSFLAYVAGKRQAQLFVERAPDGGYWVAGAVSC